MVSSVELYLNHESLGQSFAIEIGEKTQSQKYKKYKNTQLQNTEIQKYKKTVELYLNHKILGQSFAIEIGERRGGM